MYMVVARDSLWLGCWCEQAACVLRGWERDLVTPMCCSSMCHMVLSVCFDQGQHLKDMNLGLDNR